MAIGALITAATPCNKIIGITQQQRDKLPKLEPRKRVQQDSSPIPETPCLPAPPELQSLDFKKPSRRILSANDHALFLDSPAYKLLLAFIFGLADMVADTPISSVKDTDISPTLKIILKILDQVQDTVELCPPEDQGNSRFGNRGFSNFLNLCNKEHSRWHEQFDITPAAIIEVSTYLLQSFGDGSRIDYGSGHELNFMIWLLCLYQLGLITTSDFRPLVLVIFTRYLELMRLIQSKYYLEPAGSHGVWGLDDYQFLPFLFGSSQLRSHPHLRPLSIHQEFILEQYGKDYMYLGQVSFINSVKNVEGLRWHSPMLDDISSAKSWAKVEAGMRRMFIAEVLKKLPVMQHFLFGSLVPAADGMTLEDLSKLKEGTETNQAGHTHAVPNKNHVHPVTGWGDCCGIKVPSSFAAAQEMKKSAAAGGQLRRIPFD
ncbi:unnamed protein product [Blumeria hordei]|uniref:Serine/threonine-protein phosphatase 2A activator n=1 Tax=Blumeria hordei TaxID=2867405 RepID=A0A383UU22_BLUHO|nr:unnamed protein product [Blumeria hordei]